MKTFWKGFAEGSKEFSHTVVSIVNFILLSIVYFVGVGITSITSKIFGKHFLDTELNADLSTYWKKSSKKKKSIEDYYRQF